MTEMGLKSRVSKAFKPTTTSADPTKKPAPHVLDRDFEAAAPNTKWVTDIT
jgi:putative transposase